MKYKSGDKVRLNDRGFAVMPGPMSRAEHNIIGGILTIDEVCDCPTLEDPDAQALYFKETQYKCASYGVERI